MMIESFTGMIGTPDESRGPPEGGHYRLLCLPAVASDRARLPVRPRAASLGLERLRSLPRARAGARVGTAVPDNGSAVGIRLFPVDFLSPVRRPAVDSPARAGRPERADARAALCRSSPMDGPDDGRARRAP